MQFQKGRSGNPSGRPRGSENTRTQLSRLLQPYADQLINKAVELALGGDTIALRLCVERLIPKAKPDTLNVTMPDIAKLETTSPSMIALEIMKTLAGQVITIEQARLLLLLSRQLELPNTDKFDENESQLKKEMHELRSQLDKKYKREY